MKKYLFKPYDAIFPALYKIEKARLESVCKRIEHVGSTSVPGLGGKGIIDIALAISFDHIEEVKKRLESLGYMYEPKGSMPERLFFKMNLPDPLLGERTYHLHVTFEESFEWKKLIQFRDHLIAHPDWAKEYENLKKEASLVSGEVGHIYRDLKDPFFKKVFS